MLYKVWKILLPFIFLVTALHFAKDITQDIIGVPTILDNLGDIREDISYFPEWLVWAWHWAWINALLIELGLVICIPIRYANNKFGRMDWLILAGSLYLLFMTALAYYFSL